MITFHVYKFYTFSCSIKICYMMNRASSEAVEVSKTMAVDMTVKRHVLAITKIDKYIAIILVLY